MEKSTRVGLTILKQTTPVLATCNNTLGIKRIDATDSCRVLAFQVNLDVFSGKRRISLELGAKQTGLKISRLTVGFGLRKLGSSTSQAVIEQH